MTFHPRARHRIKPFGLAALTVAALALGSLSAASSEYRLRAGDVIEVSVAGLPQFGQRAPVQLDGTITIPPIGSLEVQGQTLGEVRDRIQIAFTSRILTLYASDGRELTRAVEREEVAAAIVQYAPIWVAGDVVRSGEQTFHPRMTVRQAIASAGGLRPMITTTEMQPRYDPILLQSDYVASWLALAAHAARAWRLRNELGETAEFDKGSIPPSADSEGSLAHVLAGEQRIQALRQVELERERAFLEQSAALAEEQIRSLSERLDLESQGELDDTEDYKRMQAMLRQGHLTNVRVEDARRALLYSSTRRLQTASELMQMRRRLDETRRSLEKLDHQRRLGILEELQEVERKQTEENARLNSLRAKLELAGIAVPRTARREASPAITIIRRLDADPVSFEAGYDDPVEPGDVVEVAIRQTLSSPGEQLGQAVTDRSRYAQQSK